MTHYAEQTTSTTPGRVSLAVQLLRHTLDPSASSGESQNAAMKFSVVARRERVTFESLAVEFARLLPAPVASPSPAPHPERKPKRQRRNRLAESLAATMPYGKYCGVTLAVIYEGDRPYLQWVARELGNERIRRAARRVLKHFDRQSRGRAAA